jgi:hypothetical protein
MDTWSACTALVGGKGFKARAGTDRLTGSQGEVQANDDSIVPDGVPRKAEILQHDNRVSDGDLVAQGSRIGQQVGDSVMPSSAGNHGRLKTALLRRREHFRCQGLGRGSISAPCQGHGQGCRTALEFFLGKKWNSGQQISIGGITGTWGCGSPDTDGACAAGNGSNQRQDPRESTQTASKDRQSDTSRNRVFIS